MKIGREGEMLVGYRGWKCWMGHSASGHDGIPFYYWLIGVFDAHGELLVMLLSLAIHCYISHVVILTL